jgi:hypothetical protein
VQAGRFGDSAGKYLRIVYWKLIQQHIKLTG